MSIQDENRSIQSEPHKLVEQRVLTHAEIERIALRHPSEAWDLRALAR